jgi:excisionase family DNA binding protein
MSATTAVTATALKTPKIVSTNSNPSNLLHASTPRPGTFQKGEAMTEQDTLATYKRFETETGDPLSASNLTLAHAMFSQQERAQEQALTVAEAARRLKVSKDKVYRMVESAELPHHRVGKQIRILPEDIDRFIRQSAEEVCLRPRLSARPPLSV